MHCLFIKINHYDRKYEEKKFLKCRFLHRMHRVMKSRDLAIADKVM